MLNKPKFMSPSTNIERRVVDLKADTIPFSCIVDGNCAITSWRIVVWKLKDNTAVLDTGEIKLDTPFYPVDNKNRNVVFEIDLKKYMSSLSNIYYLPATETYDKNKTYYTVSTEYEYSEYVYSDEDAWNVDYKKLYYIDFINSKEPYAWRVCFWGDNEASSVSSEEVFYANSEPNIHELTINNEVLTEDGFILGERNAFFKCEYKQDEEVSLKRYGWRLTETNTNKIIFDTISKNQIYGTKDNISCKYNGLVNGQDYLIELYIETQNGYGGIVKSIKFSVEYDVEIVDADFQAFSIDSSSCIMLNWENIKTTEGVARGEYSVKKNFPISNSSSLVLPRDSKIVFEGNANSDLQIPKTSYVVLSFQIPKDEDTDVLYITDKNGELVKELKYISDTHQFEYMLRDGDTTMLSVKEVEHSPSQTTWYVITLFPTRIDGNTGEPFIDMKIVCSKTLDALFPSESLYPSNDIYPYNGKWDKLKGGQQ